MEIAFISPGVLTDAGGFIVYVGSDGKLHVKRVPPWNPETAAELGAAFAAIDGASRIKNQVVAQQFLNAATHVLGQHLGELERAVGAGQVVAG